MKPETGIKVTVHYIAAGKPFKDDNADPNETLAQLKVRVLAFFGLMEGGNVVYKLFYKNDVLGDLSITLGQLAAREHEKPLQLNLNQDVVQG